MTSGADVDGDVEVEGLVELDEPEEVDGSLAGGLVDDGLASELDPVPLVVAAGPVVDELDESGVPDVPEVPAEPDELGLVVDEDGVDVGSVVVVEVEPEPAPAALPDEVSVAWAKPTAGKKATWIATTKINKLRLSD